MFYTTIVLIVGVLAALWYLSVYNTFIQNRNAVDQSWAHVEVELQRRWDLITNLVQVVKGYASHEAETLASIIEKRENQTTVNSANKAEPQTSNAITKIFALAESYPELKADKQFLNLQSELSITENRIAERRSAYNQTVNIYRNCFLQFPSNIIAILQEMKQKDFYDAPEESTQVPKINLG